MTITILKAIDTEDDYPAFVVEDDEGATWLHVLALNEHDVWKVHAARLNGSESEFDEQDIAYAVDWYDDPDLPSDLRSDDIETQCGAYQQMYRLFDLTWITRCPDIISRYEAKQVYGV